MKNTSISNELMENMQKYLNEMQPKKAALPPSDLFKTITASLATVASELEAAGETELAGKADAALGFLGDNVFSVKE